MISDEYAMKVLAEMEQERAIAEASRPVEPPQVGADPNRPHHPVFNPSVAELEHRAQQEREDRQREHERSLSQSQEVHLMPALRLVRSGVVVSYRDLGERCSKFKSQVKGGKQHYSARWAKCLVDKMITRKVITADEIKRLIKDTTSHPVATNPFNKKERERT